MNEFCKKCKNRSVPKTLKKKFNETYKNVFIECPTSDLGVVGCLIPNVFNIDWNSFCSWLEDNNNFTVEEAIVMARLGFLKDRKEGRKSKK